MTILLLATSLIAAPAVPSLASAPVQGHAVFARHGEAGAWIVREQGLPAAAGAAERVPDPSVAWSAYLENAIYTTTSSTLDGYVFCGTYLNAPKEAELFAPDGGGVPDWTYSGNEFYVDSADDATMMAAVDKTATGLRIAAWSGTGSSTPDWTASVDGYSVGSYGPIAVSDDGSTIAITASPPGTDAHLLLFDAGSASPLVDYEATGLGFPRYIKINSDGRYPAFIALSTLVIYDRDTLSVRDQISMGATNSAMDISGDGALVAYGWSSMRVHQWNGTSYEQLWSYATAGYYVGVIAISADGTTIVSGWYNTAHNTLRVIVHEPGSSTPLWFVDYAVSNGTYQENPADIDITDDGSHFIVGSWGDAENLNAEVNIFQRDGFPHNVYSVDMPGSVFSVDIAGDGAYATACGKHVHANENGRGGDAVMIDTGLGPDPSTIGAEMTCLPASGTVPFVTAFSVNLANLEATRPATVVAARIDATLANGTMFPNWKAGSRVIWSGTAYDKIWNQTIPALGTLIGDNLFSLTAEDVTPAPYNQPPYPPAGDTATAECTVTGIAP